MARIVRLSVPRAEVELAADGLWAAGCSAVHEEDLPDGMVLLTADVADVRGLDRWRPEVLEVDGAVHLDAWRAWARPVRAGSRIVLHPPWVRLEPVGPDDLVIELDPGRSFGSGSHPSSRLVLAELEQLVEGGEVVLDVGCGSGVLAVVAVLLGAARAVAVDVDAEAVEVTRRVAGVNGIGERVDASTTPVGELTLSAELVVANLGASTLTALAGDIVERVAPGGHLVLAGLLEDRTGDPTCDRTGNPTHDPTGDATTGGTDGVVEAYVALGLVELRRPSLDGWTAPVLRRPAG